MRLHPFRALHPRPACAGAVISPPYDVVNTAEARALALGRPDSFLRVVRPEIELPADTNPYDAAVYDNGRANLSRMIDAGTLVRDPVDAIWIYRLDWGLHSQVGFVGCAEVDDYDGGRIKRHEFTRQVKEDDRTRHVDVVSANTGPVFLTCRGGSALNGLDQRLMQGDPTLDATQAGVRHRLWRIVDPEQLATIARAFAQLDAFYIADGHHRAASASRVRALRRERHPDAPADAPFERFMVVVFPEEQLRILPYNRVVTDLGGLSTDGFLEALSRTFEVGEPGAEPGPISRHHMTLYMDGAWRKLVAKGALIDESDPVSSLDVAILQDRVLGPVLGITDPRADERVDFVGGIRGTDELVRRVDAQEGGCAFAMYPTSMSELLKVADAGLVMPPKSTWFEPKLASGLVIHPLD